MRKTWSDQEILDAIKNWAEEHGRTPKWSDWSYKDEQGLRPTNMTVWHRCGSWNDAMIMAGLEPHAAARRQTKLPPAEATQMRERRNKAARMRRKGLTNREIADKLGVNVKTVRRMIGPQGVPNPKAKNTLSRRTNLKNRTREERLADLQAALKKGGK